MRFRLHGDNLHVHRCTEHEKSCDFFDHTPAWMIRNRDDARHQLLIYRGSVAARITALTAVLMVIDSMIARLSSIMLARSA